MKKPRKKSPIAKYVLETNHNRNGIKLLKHFIINQELNIREII